MDVVEVNRPSHPEGPLAQTISGVLSISYNDSKLRNALGILDSMGGAVNERSIRSTVETSIIKASKRALDDFEHTYEALKALGSKVKTLEDRWDKVNTILSNSTQATSSIVSEARRLHHEQQVLQKKLATANAFSETFVVSEREMEVLQSSSLPIDDEFYSALAKVKQMNESCALIMAESPSAGEHIMSQTRKCLDNAYDKLKYAVESDLRSVDTFKSSSAVRSQIALLAERPLLLRDILTNLANVRRKQLSNDFMNALSNKNTSEKPLDYYMFDPVRYVGVVMAWVHSAIVNEYEYLSTLIDPDVTLSSKLSDALFADKDSDGILLEVIDSITGALNQPLRLRIGQLISTQSKVVMVDEIGSILGFYRSMMAKYDQKTLNQGFDQLDLAVNAQFDRCLLLELQAAYREKLDQHLQPPEFWGSALGTAKSIVRSYEQSMTYNPVGDETFRSRIGKVLDPFYKQCIKLSESVDSAKGHIFLLNCLDILKVSLAGFVCTTWKTEEAEEEMQKIIDLLVDSEYQTLLEESGIESDGFGKFEQFLQSVATETMKRQQLVSSPQMAKTIATRATEKFLAKYQELATSDAPYTLDEVRIMLQ